MMCVGGWVPVGAAACAAEWVGVESEWNRGPDSGCRLVPVAVQVRITPVNAAY